MKAIWSALSGWAEFRKLQEGPASAGASRRRVEGAPGPVVAALTGLLARELDLPAVLLTPGQEAAERLYTDLVAALVPAGDGAPALQLFLLPSLEVLLYEDFSPDPDLIRGRLRVLYALAEDRGRRQAPALRAPIVVASAAALLHRTLPPEVLRAAAITLRAGLTISPDDLVARLVSLGYGHEVMVERPGQFARRGGVVDIYPSSSELPVRLEFFGDEIESVRPFDPVTQLSSGAVEEITVLPAQEAVLDAASVGRAAEGIRAALARSRERLDPEAYERLEERIEGELTRLDQGAYFRGIEYYLPYLYPEPATALDYLPPETLVAIHEPEEIAARYQEFLAELDSLHRGRVERGHVLPLPQPLYASLEEALERVNRGRVISFSLLPHTLRPATQPARASQRSAASQSSRAAVPQVTTISSPPVEQFGANMDLLAQDIGNWQRQGWWIVAATQQGQRLREMLTEIGLPAVGEAGATGDTAHQGPSAGGGCATCPVVVTDRRFTEGWKLPDARLVVLTDGEIFGWHKLRRAVRRRYPGITITSLTQLREGDYVVHINHGIGVYGGLVRQQVDDVAREYLLINYAAGDKLYVPADQFDRVQKYMGGEDQVPRVNRLGGSDWERTKRRVKRSAKELAGELVQLYAARQSQPGHAFAPDTPWQQEMEAGFPYEETPDQLQSIAEVKADMEQAKPMDRLVCGDVGYGKTEVAIRAAFKAVMDNQQVAVLAPTTVLAQQHYTTFRERLTPYPIRVEMLSRFRRPKEQKRVAAELAAGTVDIVIGTHRLLSNDVKFKQLGLVIVDEEQRFGVRHKEKLKQLRATVDALTLTATPIPRTLHMALAGLRDMSVINDPPEGRRPIRTRLVEKEDELLREAMLREIERGGQIYFVHNRVESIGHVAAHVSRLLPQARVAVGHGQMAESELERVMLEFYAGDVDVLVCTTIIESGLDIPNVNTLIVDQSDRFGLAQLYQLRGRVGRSDRQAYAYLTWTPHKRLTEPAEKRLAAIREFTELGSGFRIALRDLEIRGAGNLLGPEQHGYAAAVGFDLYCQMLSDAVSELKGEEPRFERQASIDLPVDALLPADYVPSLNSRIELYRRIAGAPGENSLRDLEAELHDRFGRPLPAPAENLFRLARLKQHCLRHRVAAVRGQKTIATLHLEPPLDFARGGPDQSRGDPEGLEGPPARLAPRSIRLLRYRLEEIGRGHGKQIGATVAPDRVTVPIAELGADALFARVTEAVTAVGDALRHQSSAGDGTPALQQSPNVAGQNQGSAQPE